MGSSRRFAILATAAALLLQADLASAQVSESNTARADALFREGKALLEQSRYTEACPKLAESQHIDPATGTLLALALCHEAEGRRATAWREFGLVLAASQADGRTDRAKLARDHISALEPSLSKLVVVVPEGAPPSLVVQCDGQTLTHEELNTAVPADPGEHTIGAIAPGRQPWTTKVVVGAKDDTKVVTIPSLEAAAPLPPPPPVVRPVPLDTPLSPPSPAPAENAPSHTLPFVLGGTGITSLGVGTVFGVLAVVKSHDAIDACGTTPPNCPHGDNTALSENSTARAYAWVADFTLGAGAAALVAGVTLLLLPSHASSSSAARGGRLRLAPGVAQKGGGVSLVGAF